MTSAALTVNKEWNTKLISTENGEVAEEIVEEFHNLWNSEYALPYDDFYDDDDDDDEDYDDPDDEKLYETDDPDDTGISKRYGKETFRRKGGFMHKLLEGIEDDLDDNLEDDLDDPEEDTDDREKEREKRKDHYRDADDEDIMLQKELAEEVRSSMLGRKKKTTQKDTDDDIEFIDL